MLIFICFENERKNINFTINAIQRLILKWILLLWCKYLILGLWTYLYHYYAIKHRIFYVCIAKRAGCQWLPLSVFFFCNRWVFYIKNQGIVGLISLIYFFLYLAHPIIHRSPMITAAKNLHASIYQRVYYACV